MLCVRDGVATDGFSDKVMVILDFASKPAMKNHEHWQVRSYY